MKTRHIVGGLLIALLLAVATAASCLGYLVPFGWTAENSCAKLSVALTSVIILAMIGVAIYSLAGLMEPVHQRERRIDTPPDA